MSLHELNILILTALSMGFFHTLFGPDHYLPFVVMSKARKWSLKKTTIITMLCGLGHVAGSFFLGIAGVLLTLSVSKLTLFESLRGSMAAWALIAFGLVYFIWGLRSAYKNKPHRHKHVHASGSEHTHEHNHTSEHAHVHDGKTSITPWILFTIFVLGPCEPFIPVLLYPAARHSVWGIVLVTLVFCCVTVVTMTGIVVLSLIGFSFVPLKKLERFAHSLAGLTILISGLAIQFLGL